MHSIRTVIFLILTFILQFQLFAQSIPNVPSEKPKLVVVVVVDQMRYDLLTRFKSDFSPNGFNRIVSEGTLCSKARHEYFLTQQLTGYATIVTGAFPSMHGIISDSWFSRVNNKEVFVAVDNNIMPVGASPKENGFSPKDLQIHTLWDELTLATQSRSKIHSVALNGKVAAISGGFTSHGAWWFDIYSGNWITSSYYRDSLPRWLIDFNSKKIPDIYVNRQWTPKKPVSSDTVSQPSFVKAFFRRVNFLYNLIESRTISQSYRILTQTPMGITLTFDMAKQVIVNESLGKDLFPDVLVIGINPTGTIVRKYGLLSIELEDTYLRLDEELGHFINFLDQEIGLKDVLMVLTSDCGSSHDPKFLQQFKLPAGVFDQKQLITLSGSYLNAIYGKGNWILGYRNKQFYLNHTLIEDSKLSLNEMQDRLARFVLQFTGVANALPAYTLQSTNFSHGTFVLMQRSYNQRRSGDVIINLDPGWIEKSDDVVQSNSGYDYDTHVPLVWFGWKVPRMVIYRHIPTTSIASTLAAFLDIVPPGGASGEVLYDLMQKNR